MNITAYFDESGTHGGSAAVAFAGFLGVADEWGAFTFEWQNALDEFGIEMFHMASFESRVGEFEGWTEEVRRNRLGRLLAIINRHVLGSVGTVIPLADYNAIFDGPARARTGGPYGLAAFGTFLEVGQLVRPLRGDPWVAYVLESGAKGAGQLTKLFHDNEQDENSKRPLRLLSLSFQNKRDSLPLQAADIHAYELYKHLPRHLGVEKRPTRWTLRALGSMPRNWGYVEAGELRKWREIIDLGLVHSTGTWHLDPSATPPARHPHDKPRSGR